MKPNINQNCVGSKCRLSNNKIETVAQCNRIKTKTCHNWTKSTLDHLQI